MNKTILSGRLTKDLELSYTSNNTAYTKFNLAVERSFKKEGEPTADFIRCVAWGKQAEAMSKFLNKGSLFELEGRIQTGKYNDKDGKMIYTTDIVVERFGFLEKKQEQGHYEPQNRQNSPSLDISEDDVPF